MNFCVNFQWNSRQWNRFVICIWKRFYFKVNKMLNESSFYLFSFFSIQMNIFCESLLKSATIFTYWGIFLLSFRFSMFKSERILNIVSEIWKWKIRNKIYPLKCNFIIILCVYFKRIYKCSLHLVLRSKSLNCNIFPSIKTWKEVRKKNKKNMKSIEMHATLWIVNIEWIHIILLCHFHWHTTL